LTGPAAALVEARHRMLLAALAAFDGAVGPTGNSLAYSELSDAARHLVLAQNAWDDHAEAMMRDQVSTP
jgi:hypothetical protein